MEQEARETRNHLLAQLAEEEEVLGTIKASSQSKELVQLAEEVGVFFPILVKNALEAEELKEKEIWK